MKQRVRSGKMRVISESSLNEKKSLIFPFAHFCFGAAAAKRKATDKAEKVSPEGESPK